MQKFIVPAPEPGTLALLICGMLLLCRRLMRRGQLTTPSVVPGGVFFHL